MTTENLIPVTETENRGFLAGIKSAAAGLSQMLGLRRPHSPSAGPTDAVPVPTKAGFLSNVRLAAARLTGFQSATMGDGHGETVARLQAETIRLEARVTELDAEIAAMPEGVTWLRGVTVGGLSIQDHPPRTAFEHALLNAFQDALSARIRAVGIPASLLSGAN